jgi:hypothetical protein
MGGWPGCARALDGFATGSPGRRPLSYVLLARRMDRNPGDRGRVPSRTVRRPVARARHGLQLRCWYLSPPTLARAQTSISVIRVTNTSGPLAPPRESDCRIFELATAVNLGPFPGMTGRRPERSLVGGPASTSLAGAETQPGTPSGVADLLHRTLPPVGPWRHARPVRRRGSPKGAGRAHEDGCWSSWLLT